MTIELVAGSPQKMVRFSHQGTAGRCWSSSAFVSIFSPYYAVNGIPGAELGCLTLRMPTLGFDFRDWQIIVGRYRIEQCIHFGTLIFPHLGRSDPVL